MKLAPQSVRAIKAELALGEKTKAQIARDYGVSRGTIFDISIGRIHADVPTADVQKVPDGTQPKQYDPTDNRVLDLENQVAVLRDENNQLRRVNKARAKQQGFFQSVADVLATRVLPFPALPPARPRKTDGKKTKEHLVMHLSDGHHDAVVHPDSCAGLENYNFAVSCRRAETYVDTTLDFTQNLLSTYEFTDLTILAYGDHTCGEIHNAAQHSEYGNQLMNCLAIGQLHALMIRDLAPHFRSVDVLYLPGNHGRRAVKKDYHSPRDNWDYLVGKVAELHCAGIPNVSFALPNAYCVNVLINGVGFNVSHGDDDRGTNGIPFISIGRRQKNFATLSQRLDLAPIRYFAIGHHHINGSLSDLGGEALLNGAWLGTDPYSFNSFCGYREPTQLIHGVNPKYGVTWRLPVNLRTADDSQGPKRYKVVI